MNAVDPDHPAQLLVNDNHSGRTFLIDTGAQVSLLPATAHARRHPSPTAPKLVAANGSSIASYGTQQTHVQLGKRKFTVTFIIADVRRPILGADFLRRHKLLVDLCGQKLIDAHSFQSYACAATNNDLCVSPVATVDSNHYKQCLLQHYPKLLRPTFHVARQQFLGMINFYRKFLPNGAALLKPLYEAVKGTHKKTQLNWTSDMQTAFNAAKCSLSASATLAHPLPNSTIALTTDASDIGIGACLEQHTERGWQPISFFSKKLKKSEQKYSTFDRELLALYEAVRHFRYFLEGRNFIMFTDHQPLVKSLHIQADPWSTRQQRHLSYISEHSTDIRHIAGKHNIIADYLSRSPISDTCNRVSMGLDLQALAAAQSTCQDTQSYRTAITGMTVADVPVHEGGPSFLCDTSSSKPRPIVPPGYRRHVFDLLHGLSHLSSRASKELICSRYVWHGMKKDITHWCNECLSCQASKIQRHYRALVEAIPVPPRRFTHVHVDIVGPWPTSRGSTYLLTILDRTTRWPEAVPLQDITAASCARAFMTGWVARFGVPLQMTSDRGRQFISSLWSEMARSLGTQLHRTTSYHPQANEMVERFHRSLKASLRARLHDGNWIDELPWVLLGLRTATKEDLQTSPAEMVFGDSPLLPGEFASSGKTPFFPSFTQTSTSSPQHHRVDTPTPLATLARSKYVFVRVGPQHPSLQRPYQGPFKVIQTGNKTFKVLMNKGPQTISVDRLKPAKANVH